jgi:hypothetical protein
MSVAFPVIVNPSEMSWRLRARTQTHTSPFDGTVQTLALPGARWEASVSWRTLSIADSRTLAAFISSLGGVAGRFFYGPVHAPRRATGSGSPVINGASQTGSTLSTRGWSANAQAFLVGDWLSYTDTTGRRRLHQVTANVTANSSGVASVPIAPALRRSGADGAAVTITAPTGVFMLASDEEGQLSVRAPLLGAMTLNIVEAII